MDVRFEEEANLSSWQEGNMYAERDSFASTSYSFYFAYASIGDSCD